MQLLLPAVLNAVRTTGGRWYALKQSHHRIYSYDWYNPLWSVFLEQIPISDCRFRIRRLWVVRYPIKSLSNLIKCPLNSHQIPLNPIKSDQIPIKSPSNPIKTPWKSPDFVPNPQILLNQDDSTPCSARSPPTISTSTANAKAMRHGGAGDLAAVLSQAIRIGTPWVSREKRDENLWNPWNYSGNLWIIHGVIVIIHSYDIIPRW